MNQNKWMYFISGFLLVMSNTYAKDVTITGLLKHKLKSEERNVSSVEKPAKEDIIQLLQVELSEEAKKVLTYRAQDALSHTGYFSANYSDDTLPEKVRLGMNKTPVLNQGIHGTCTTFAVTGAIDALVKKGDYVSQLCQLELSAHLQQQGTGSNSWNGAYAKTVLRQMARYGIVNKKKQHKLGCSGYHYYPAYSYPQGAPMETAQFMELSEPVFGSLAFWSDIPVSLTYNSNPEATLNEVKKTLHSGNRVIFATLLPRTDLGNAGAVGRHKTWIARDSWVLTPDILAGAPKSRAAHELIITGYDDNAVAVDSEGKKHKGLLILRNSWSWLHGDWGNFYMSYDYFKLLAYDAQKISSSKS